LTPGARKESASKPVEDPKEHAIKMLDYLQNRKGALKEDLVMLEKQIYELEGRYLEETKESGSVLHGWDQLRNQ
jgi:hypothetical protein